MYICNVDMGYEKQGTEKAAHLQQTVCERPCSSRVQLCEPKNSSPLLMTTRFRKRTATSVTYHFEEDSSEEEKVESDLDYDVGGKPSGGKYYEKKRICAVSDESCILADRRMTSLRQQTDQLLSVVDKDKISAPVSTLY